MTRSTVLLLVTALSVFSGCAATPVVPFSEVGDSIEFSQLKNQHGADYENSETKRLVLFVNDMGGKKIISKSLEKIDMQCLSDGQVVYVADISGMPSIISSLIAVPKMRKYSYPLWLDRDGDSTQALPVKDHAVSVISTERQKITGIEFFEDDSLLMKKLVSVCGEQKH